MQGQDDLKQAVADVEQQEVTLETTLQESIAVQEEILAKLQSGGGLTDEEAGALALRLQTHLTAQKAALSNLAAETDKDKGVVGE